MATQKNQVSEIKAEFGLNIQIFVDPTRKYTFPAIALASAYLVKNGIDVCENVVVCPVDSFVDEKFYKTIIQLNPDNKNITLLGIKPTHPSEKYDFK